MEKIQTEYLKTLKEKVKDGKAVVVGSSLYLDKDEALFSWETPRLVYDETNVPLGKKVVRLYIPWVGLGEPSVFNSYEGIPKGFYLDYRENTPSFVTVRTPTASGWEVDRQLVGLYNPFGELYGTAWVSDNILFGPGHRKTWLGDTWRPFLYAAHMELPEEEISRFVGKAQEELTPQHAWFETSETNALKTLIANLVLDQKLGISFLQRAGKFLDIRLRLFDPVPAVGTQGNISIYQTAEKRLRDLRTSMKPGRAFRFMFPEATDRETEVFVDAFRKTFPTQELVIKEGKGRGDFKHMYQHNISPTENVVTSHARKSLSCSCMRHSFGSVHPAEAYASGEFTALWSEDTEGRIASRVVVHDTSETFGPIYGTTEYSVDILETKLRELGYKLGNDSVWVGAKVQLIEKDGGYAFPYVDFGLVPDVDTATNEGGISVAKLTYNEDDLPTGGVFYPDDGSRCYCNICEDRIWEEEAFTSPEGDYVCERCYYDNYGTCEYTESTVSQEDLVEAHWSTWGSSCYCGLVDVNVLCDYFVETYNGAWYHNNLVVELATGDYAYREDGAVAESDLTGEWHFVKDMDHCIAGEVCATAEEFKDAGYTKTDAGWDLVEEEEEIESV